MQTILLIHIAAGGLAILTGYAALFAPKGGGLHRRSGTVFVGAMVAMGLGASVVAVGRGVEGSGYGGLLAGASDFRVIRSGPLRGGYRLARHLWRMCFAMFLATGSFFLGQADELPQALRIPLLLAIPALLPLPIMFLWLWRVRARRSFGGAGEPRRGSDAYGPAGERPRHLAPASAEAGRGPIY